MSNPQHLDPAQLLQARNECIGFQLANKSIEVSEEDTTWDKLDKAFHEVPHSKFIEQAQYLKEQLLPKIAEKRGITHPDYKFYYAVFESLMYSLKVLDRDHSLRFRLTNEKSLREFYQNKVVHYEDELLRFITMEDLLRSETAKEIITRNTL
jgi:hypothetical protein